MFDLKSSRYIICLPTFLSLISRMVIREHLSMSVIIIHTLQKHTQVHELNYPAEEIKGYCDESEVGALNCALSGIDETICATLDTVGLRFSFIKSSDWKEPPNSLAIWSTPLFSSKQNMSNLW